MTQCPECGNYVTGPVQSCPPTAQGIYPVHVQTTLERPAGRPDAPMVEARRSTTYKP